MKVNWEEQGNNIIFMIYKNDVKNDTCPVILSSKIGCSSTAGVDQTLTNSLHWQSSLCEFIMRLYVHCISSLCVARFHCESPLCEFTECSL